MSLETPLPGNQPLSQSNPALASSPTSSNGDPHRLTATLVPASSRLPRPRHWSTQRKLLTTATVALIATGALAGVLIWTGALFGKAPFTGPTFTVRKERLK